MGHSSPELFLPTTACIYRSLSLKMEESAHVPAPLPLLLGNCWATSFSKRSDIYSIGEQEQSKVNSTEINEGMLFLDVCIVQTNWFRLWQEWYQLFVHTPVHNLHWFSSPDKQMVQHPEFSDDIHNLYPNLSVSFSLTQLDDSDQALTSDLGFSQLLPLAK